MLAYRTRSTALAARAVAQQVSATKQLLHVGTAVGGLVRRLNDFPLPKAGSRGLRFLSSLPDHIVVGMPALSPTMTHGNIGTWAKQVGDAIAAGDVVCEVETDKATVDFDAQDDSFMAKHLVEAGTQDIPVGTPIFVTVDDADSVAAFKNFIVDAGVPAPAPVEPAPVEEGKETPPPPPLPLAEPKQESTTPLPSASAPAPAELTAALAPASAPAKTQNTSGSSEQLVFKRDWGSGVRGSPLAHRMSAEQKKYVELFGPTLQTPLEP